jgi:hypothetical protein
LDAGGTHAAITKKAKANLCTRRWLIKHGAADYKTGRSYGERPPLVLAHHLNGELEAWIDTWRAKLGPQHDFLFTRHAPLERVLFLGRVCIGKLRQCYGVPECVVCIKSNDAFAVLQAGRPAAGRQAPVQAVLDDCAAAERQAHEPAPREVREKPYINSNEMAPAHRLSAAAGISLNRFEIAHASTGTRVCRTSEERATQASASLKHWQSTWGTGDHMPRCDVHKSWAGV